MMTGLDVSKTPSEVISIAGAFITTPLPQNIYLNIKPYYEYFKIYRIVLH
jgi:hypothetical protein